MRGSRRLAAVAVASGREDVGEESGEEGACTGEAGADNCDVAFDGRPGCGADVVVCRWFLLDFTSWDWGLRFVVGLTGWVV